MSTGEVWKLCLIIMFYAYLLLGREKLDVKQSEVQTKTSQSRVYYTFSMAGIQKWERKEACNKFRIARE